MAEMSNAQWAELTRDLSARVAAYAPGWTEPVGNDPGITLVDLFGFLAESLLSRGGLSVQARSRLRGVIEQVERADDIDCADAALTRTRYFAGKLLTADDLARDQDYHRSRQRRHNRLLHGIGIVRGLAVSLEVSADGGEPTVVVSPGIAISPDGEELVVCKPMTRDGWQGLADCYVTLALVERPAAPTPQGEPSRIDESAEVVVSGDVPPGHLAIGRMLKRHGQWRLDSSFKPPRLG
ncbi:MAG TPA: hypothetical protein VIV06_10045 [Candidatus Limnocylindrales bacterium]